MKIMFEQSERLILVHLKLSINTVLGDTMRQTRFRFRLYYLLEDVDPRNTKDYEENR